MSAAWFCPSCQRHHAPHVETCPGGTGGIDTDPWGIRFLPHFTPWRPYDPCAGCKGPCGNVACPKLSIVTSAISFVTSEPKGAVQ